MLSIFSLIKLLIAIGPDLIAFVQKLETIFPEAGQGAVKLEMLKAYMLAIWTTVGNALPIFEKVWPTIQSIVAGIVALFNKTGIFKK